MTTIHNAIVRKPGRNMGDGLTTAGLGAPVYELAAEQHAGYITSIERAGVEVLILDSLPAFPDAHFVEDVAVVTPEVAVIARPGASARRGEEECMEPILARHRPIARINDPGHLDGGDVLVMSRHVLVGLSSRTNAEGARQLLEILASHGYGGTMVSVGHGLHLKSSINLVADDTLLVTTDFADHPALTDYQRIVVPEGEEYSANVLRVNGTLLVPKGFPQTKARVECLGMKVVEVDVSEMQKMDGGLTCLSLRV